MGCRRSAPKPLCAAGHKSARETTLARATGGGANGGMDDSEAAVNAMDVSPRPVFRASLSLVPMQASGPVKARPSSVGRRRGRVNAVVTLGRRGSLEGTRRSQDALLHILALGWEHMVLLTPRGAVVTTLPLRGAPISPPTLGDFTNDGITDIIVVRRNGYARARVGANQDPSDALLTFGWPWRRVPLFILGPGSTASARSITPAARSLPG